MLYSLLAAWVRKLALPGDASRGTRNVEILQGTCEDPELLSQSQNSMHQFLSILKVVTWLEHKNN